MAKKRPGWQIILDAFMVAPGRKLTNVQLGELGRQPGGPQAWHQRITDLRKKGYIIEEALVQRDADQGSTITEYVLKALPSSPITPPRVFAPAPAEPSPEYAPELADVEPALFDAPAERPAPQNAINDSLD